MAYDSIPDAWRDVGKAVKQELVERIHDNLEDLDQRVTNVEGSISTTVIANQLIQRERDHAPIGTMVWSPLSEAQFQTATDDGGWELCDGSSVAGSDYATLMSRTTVPDVRGKFLRMRAHGTSTTYNVDGDVATDTVQADALESHLHTINHGHSNTFAVSGTFASDTHVHNMAHVHKMFSQASGTGSGFPGDIMYALTDIDDAQGDFTTGASGIRKSFSFEGYDASAFGANPGTFSVFPTGETDWYTSGVLDAPTGTDGAGARTNSPTSTASPSISGSVTSVTTNSGSTGAGETRPHNVTENLFIKINKNYITVRNGYILWRAPQAITINQVVLSPVTQGTSGTLTVDVKKGALDDISTSIFSSAPSLAYNGAAAVTGTIDPTNAAIAAGEYVRVDITATQAKLQEFHILIAATPT